MESPLPGSGTMTATAADAEQTFAANRALGRVTLEVQTRNGATCRARVREEGSLRVRFPGHASEMEAVTVNTAGGIAGGDRFDLSFSAGPGTRLVVASAAAEKVYRSLGPCAVVDVKLDVAVNASLAWLPQETILFDRAMLSRRIEVDLAEGATLLIAEAIVFGRSGMGEAVEAGCLIDRWRVRRGGRLMFAEAVRLEGAISGKLRAAAVARGGVAIATVLIVPGDDAIVAKLRALESGFRGEVGISAWNGFAVARFCAENGAQLRHDLVAVLNCLRGGALPRLWLN
jgi:urease accessory protein